MRKFFASAFLALAFAASAITGHSASAEDKGQPTNLTRLVDAVEIPYERFELENGLVTLVHTDRKAPIVGVTIYYRVGSKHEPRGKTGFAHLYEHLFFGGSANVEHFDKPLDAAGSTTPNGSTWYDRTNYVITLPTGALDLALFMESDRMGYLLPAVTQDKLDKQRGVVQNEKRQGDNEPYGLMQYATSEGLFPVGHPYRHATIGSMADLDAASLEDVRNWFRDNYGPNNVVLVLTGDIDAQTARPLVEKWFGAIQRGPDVRPVDAGPVTLSKKVRREMTDQVPVARLTRNWTGPGLNHPDAIPLKIGMHILGGLASSRLDNALVRENPLAVSVSAGAYDFEQLSFIEASMDVKPEVDRAVAEREFDKVIANFLATGPTEDEVRRAVASTLSYRIGSLEYVGGFGGKGKVLAEGELYSGDPARFQKDLAAMAALTPADIKAAMQRWLSRPVYELDVLPGERTEDGAQMGGWGGDADGHAKKASRAATVPEKLEAPQRHAPPVLPVQDLDFPDIERASLSNGIPVALARRTAVPKVEISMEFDAGIVADALDTPGTQGLMMAMLKEGTKSRTATQIAEDEERIGAHIGSGAELESSSVTLSALTAKLSPSLALMADVVRNPAFDDAEVARIRSQRIAELAQVTAQPRSLASRELRKVIFGAHPYAQPTDGLGDAESLAAITPERLRIAHREWLEPGRARITVVGDISMDQLLPALEQAFGDWKNGETSLPETAQSAAVAKPLSRIILMDRPNSPQSVIMAGRVLPLDGMDPDQEVLDLANEILGGGYLSRLNDDIREEKGWSYGVRSGIGKPTGPRHLAISAPVQADRTGDTIRVIRQIMAAYPGDDPITDEEMERVIEGNIRNLPVKFESNAQVLGAILANDRLGRGDDYYETLASRYRALKASDIEQAAREFLRPEGLVFVVVGDRKVVEPQLQDLDLPIEIVPTANESS